MKKANSNSKSSLQSFLDDRFSVSFYKDRCKEVKVFRRKTIALIKSSSGDTQKYYQKKLDSICYFDQPSYRRSLIKITNILSNVHGTLRAKQLVSWYVGLFEKRSLNNGPTSALKFFKELYGYACRFSSSNIANPISYTKSNKEGFPKVLKPLLIEFKGDLHSRKMGLAILSIFKLVESHDYGKPFEAGAITKQPLSKTSPFTEDLVEAGTYFREAYENENVRSKLPNDFKINRWIRCYNVVLKRMFRKSKSKSRFDEIKELSGLHFSGRNGPNGPALLTIMQDFKALQNAPQLLDQIKELSTLTGNSQLNKLIAECEKSVVTEFPPPTKDYPIQKVPIHSKISLKSESWGRLRPFAIADYFTQSSVLGFHKWLFSQLESYKEDCTFEQTKGANAIRIWSTLQIEIESADLSEATNAIPLLVQREIINAIAGNRFGYLWCNIMSNRDYKIPGKDMVFIRYSCGQPMGTLSSWPMLAMWHHVISRTVLTYLGINWGRKLDVIMYYIIGDDIAMKSRIMFHIYESVVGVLQDVGISKTKGFHSETQTLENCLEGYPYMSTAEFAKRIFCNGFELTPIQPAEIHEYITHPYMLPNVVISLLSRDYPLDADQVKFIAEQSNDFQLALDALCVPDTLDPEMGDLMTILEQLQDQTIWGSENDCESLLELLIEEIREKAYATINSATAGLVAWAQKFSNDKIAVKVRTWSILGRAYHYLFQQLSQELGTSYSMKYAEIFSEFEGLTPENWKQFFRSLGKLQVVFDLDEKLKNVNSLKPKKDKYVFISSLLGKAIKQVRKSINA